jgi:DNA-directed RNA polymerase specialized sigma24 family protein
MLFLRPLSEPGCVTLWVAAHSRGRQGVFALEANVEEWAWNGEFDRFVAEFRPRLVRALAGCVGPADAADAAAEAIAYAFEHWPRLRGMDNPAGYLFRVGRSRVRRRMTPSLPAPDSIGVPDIEPALIPALLALPETQRTAVWLVYACEWRYAEVAEAMGTTVSMVGNHVSRGLESLRRRLGVATHA